MNELLIKNGTLVTGAGCYQGDISIRDGKIISIGTELISDEAKVIDASGLYVLPGAVDAHTHLATAFGGTVSSDDYFTGTRAAACGGTTTVIDYANQHDGQGILECVRERLVLADSDACVDYAFHCVLTDLKGGKILEEFPAAIDFGITSVKCYMVYKKEGMMLDDAQIVQVLLRGRETGMLTNVHAENPDVIDALTERFLREGKTSPWYHYLSRPEWVEAEADKRILHWAKSTGGAMYLVHLADAEGLEEMIRAKRSGAKVYAETCPQYLAFTREVYQRPDGRNFVCSPPIKGEESQSALWKAIRDGNIDTIATDHCPFLSSEKAWGKDDFTKIPNGCGGVEQRYPYLLSAALEGRLSLEQAAALCAENPARIFGCAQKGSLRPGKDADIVLFDPAGSLTISQENSHSACDYTIWEGMRLRGKIVGTYVRGELVYNGRDFVGRRGFGRYLRRTVG